MTPNLHATAGLPLPDEFGLLQTLFDLSPTALELLHPLYGPAGALVDFALDYRNPAGQELLGLPAQEGLSLLGRFPQTGPTGVVGFYRHVFETGEPGAYEVQDQADGLDRHLHLAARRSGDRLLVSITNAAAPDRSGVQEALRAAQAREREGFYQVFEQTPALINILRGPEHRFAYFNAAQERVFPGRQLLGHPLADVLPDAASQGFTALLDQVYQTGESYKGTEVPALLDQPDGSPARRHYFDFTYQRFEEDGQPAGISVFGHDVTERVLARQERDAHQVRQQELFEQAPVAMGIFAGPDYVVEICNPGLQALWGRTAAQVLHRPLFDVLPEVRDQGFEQMLDQVRTTGVPYVAHEMPGQVLRDGRPTAVHLNFVYQPLRDAHGVITAIAVVATDVSEQVAARRQVQAVNQQLAALNDKLYAANAALADTNEELDDANQRLAHTNGELDTFVYTASHDLKTPITNLEGLLHALRQELPVDAQTGPAGHVLALMKESVTRFQQTLTHLAAIARLQPDAGQAVGTMGLADVVRDVLLDMAVPIAEAGAQLDVDVAAGPPLRFLDSNLRSVVYNLLSNAVKYRHPDRVSRVRVHFREAPPYRMLEVADNGLGLELRPDRPLFGLFQRFHAHVDGSGVGLYMVKKMLENSGGRVEVTSRLGVGSTFTVYFKD